MIYIYFYSKFLILCGLASQINKYIYTNIKKLENKLEVWHLNNRDSEKFIFILLNFYYYFDYL